MKTIFMMILCMGILSFAKTFSMQENEIAARASGYPKQINSYDDVIAALDYYITTNTWTWSCFTEFRKKLIDQNNKGNVDPNLTARWRFTLLMRAAEKGDEKISRFLISQGADVSLRNQYGNTALMYAAVGGNKKVYDLLLESGAQIDETNKSGRGVIYWAAQGGNYDLFMDALSRVKDKKTPFLKESTIILDAVKGANMDIIKYIVDQGVDINNRDENQNAVMITAAYMTPSGDDSYVLMDYLLDHGADINARNKMRTSALSWALNRGTVSYTMGTGNAWSQADKRFLDYLIERGADINLPDDRGMTALLSAIDGANLKMVEFLVQKGGDIMRKDNEGKTALMYVLKQAAHPFPRSHKEANVSQEQMIALLSYCLDQGVDINAKDHQGKTVLTMATEQNKEKVAEFLRSKGAKS